MPRLVVSTLAGALVGFAIMRRPPSRGGDEPSAAEGLGAGAS